MARIGGADALAPVVDEGRYLAKHKNKLYKLQKDADKQYDHVAGMEYCMSSAKHSFINSCCWFRVNLTHFQAIDKLKIPIFQVRSMFHISSAFIKLC